MTLGLRVLAALGVAAAAPVTTPTAADKTAILRVVERMKQAWNRGDFRGYMAGFEKQAAAGRTGRRRTARAEATSGRV